MEAGWVSRVASGRAARALASAWLVLAAVGCACEEAFGFLADRCYEFRTVAEAQGTVLFTICEPEHLPATVRPEPRVVSLVDWANPDHPWVRLLYYDTDGDTLVMDLGERYDPGVAQLSLEPSESYARAARTGL